MFWDVIVCSIKLSLWVFLKTLKRKYCQQKKSKYELVFKFIWLVQFCAYVYSNSLLIRGYNTSRPMYFWIKCMESIFWTNNNVYLLICSQIHLNILRLRSMKLKYTMSRGSVRVHAKSTFHEVRVSSMK